MAKSKKKDAFSISLKLGDKTFEGTGATALAALQAIQKPAKMMGKAIVTVRNGPLSKEMMFFPTRLKRLFYNPSYQVIQAKFLAAGLK